GTRAGTSTTASMAPLPLYGYTAVGMRHDRLVVAALQTDEHHKWNPRFFNTPDLKERVSARLADDPDNRILRQLAKCSLDYSCFTAQNIFYQRWEGGLPVSPACNAACLGCISLQESECCPSPQGRIAFQPNLDEAVRVATTHLSSFSCDDDPIISFGQGCEGEPSLEADLIAQIIAQTRKTVSRGVFNINTNGGYTDGIAKIAAAGLNSARFSIISAAPTDFCSYYRPKGYQLDNVARSIDICMGHGVYVALNLLCLPGYTDRADQMEALSAFLAEHPVNMIQLRNLNIDPDSLPEQFRAGQGAGFAALIERLTAIVGRDGIGNYTRVQTTH
ncbi:MAG TPA: radical SAM protein, partial [Firmicutes bacterium]|nr:radical SAM protein [Bacillota bacterium]